MALSPKRYELKEQAKTDFHSDFRCISECVRLDSLSRQDAHDIVRSALGNEEHARIGVYSWVLIVDDRIYSIYIGKTKDIARRLTDYLIPFQVHSPNDFKLRFFQKFIFRRDPSASFSLFFKKCPAGQLTQSETELCRKYRPLINERSEASAAAKAQVRDAFETYYDSIFEKKINS